MLLVLLCAISVITILIVGQKSQTKLLYPDGDARIVPQKRFLYGVIIVLVLVSTVRYGFIDTYAYKIMYTSSRNNLEYVNSAPWGVEAGWLYFLYILNFISSSPKLMLFIVAMFVNLAYIKMCSKYSADVLFSIFIYFCIGYMDTNNGLRQCFAASLCMLATPLAINRKYIPYAIIVAIASIFHKSAIYVLVIMLVAIGKPINIKVILLLIALLVFAFIPNTVSKFLADNIINDKYSDYATKTVGMGIMRCIIIGVIPMVLSIVYTAKSKKSGVNISREESILINLTIINGVLYLMGLYMQYWARLAFYTSFAPIVLMPKLMREVIDKKGYMSLKIFAGILYFIFFAYNIYVNIQYGAIADFYIDL